MSIAIWRTLNYPILTITNIQLHNKLLSDFQQTYKRYKIV